MLSCENWRGRIWNQKFIHWEVRHRWEKQFHTSIKYHRFWWYRKKCMSTVTPLYHHWMTTTDLRIRLDARRVASLSSRPYWQVPRVYIDINSIIYNVNIHFLRYHHNLWYLIEVWNCFSQRCLTSQRMNFWFQIRPCQFSHKSIVRSVLNLSTF